MGERRTVTAEELLAAAREGLPRLDPEDAAEAFERGAVLVDIREDGQRVRDGVIPGALRIPRNVLEWRLDPRGEHRIDELTRPGVEVILFCNHGYQSSLAAANVRRMGVECADVIGGFEAWREAGLPVRQRAAARAQRQ